MFDEIVYRQSIIRLRIALALDIILSVALVGIFLLLYHIIEYKKHVLILTKNGIVLKKGWIGSLTTEIPYSKINSVTVKKNLFGNLLHFGDIVILSGNDIRGEVFANIQDPDLVKSEIILRLDQPHLPQLNTHPSIDAYVELEELAKLLKKEIITRDEFNAKKKQLLKL